jgi:RNA polymerase subunit RPABC4/transcription elongation factor Spt4|tara:strand:+ start:129 stop:353 length:225 start_codon:yes stop_codon:yes gene_type:complete
MLGDTTGDIKKMAKKVCKKCLIFVTGGECPLCKASGHQLSQNWQGRINVIDSNKSKIAKKIDIDVKGEYALKAR